MDKEFEKKIEAAMSVAFVGEALSPFFLNDPCTGSASAAFAAMSKLNAYEASREWPFVDPADAFRALSLMVDGLGGADISESEEEFTADDALVDEYRRLFIGPAPKPAPPWGSVYTDRDCVVFGESTLALRAWLSEKGIVRMSDERTPEDHIGLMLALMSYIARTQTGDLVEYLQLHLLPWSSHFLQELSAAAEHPFYRGLSELTNMSLSGIQEALGIKVSIPRFYR